MSNKKKVVGDRECEMNRKLKVSILYDINVAPITHHNDRQLVYDMI